MKKVFINIIIVLGIGGFLVSIFQKRNKIANIVNYAPNGFEETIAASICDIVISTRQQGLFWIIVGKREFPFSYNSQKLPNDGFSSYPENFIQIGDSILKNANSDTFYLIRRGEKWQYILPR
jgi:hypothetical protein